MRLYKCVGLKEENFHYWNTFFKIGGIYKHNNVNKSDWLSLYMDKQFSFAVERSQFQLITEPDFINYVEVAFRDMQMEFHLKDFMKAVYNPTGCGDGTATRSLRKLRKRGTINYKADNIGNYTKL